MKKLSVLIIALALALCLSACGGSAPASASVAPASSSAASAGFSAEQQAFAQEFMALAAAFDEISDRVNATPEALASEELVAGMNELADAIIAADEFFASPEALTPEVMSQLKEGIEETYKFVDAAKEALDQIDNERGEGVTVPVEIINGTGVDIYALALSPANNNDWGENLIDEVIKNGETVQGELVFTADTLVWDILVQDSEGTQLTFMGVDFSDADADGAKLSLEATESGKYFAVVH